MRRILFYVNLAVKNLRHSGHWTTFAVFCVAAGVATVVALRSLGLTINDSLISNLRQVNHGDINVSSIASLGPFEGTLQRGDYEVQILNKSTVDFVRQWAGQHNALISPYSLVSNIHFAPFNQTSSGIPQFASTFLI